MESSLIPEWAQRFLNDIEKEVSVLKEKWNDLRDSNNQKISSFYEIKAKKEAELRLKLHNETTNYNNKIMQLRASSTSAEDLFHKNKEALMKRLQDIEKEVQEKSDLLLDLKKKEESLMKDIKDSKLKEQNLDRKILELQTKTGLKNILQTENPQYPSVPPNKFLIEDPNTKASISPSTEIGRLIVEDRKKALSELFLCNKQTPFIAIVYHLGIIGEDIGEAMLLNIIKLHEYYGLEQKLFEYLFNFEVTNSKSLHDITSYHSISSKVFELYGIRCATNYLKDTVRHIILEIVQDNRKFIIDPEVVIDQKIIEVNINYIKDIVNKIITSIDKSHDNVPIQFRQLCNIFKKTLSKRYPQDHLTALSFLVFNSFICKAIQYPRNFNLEIKDVGEHSQKYLDIISLTISKIATGTFFSENHLVSINSIIADTLSLSKKFIINICKPNDKCIYSTVVPVHANIVVDEQLKLLYHIPPVALLKIREELERLDKKIYKVKLTYFLHEILKLCADHLMDLPTKQFTLDNPFVIGFIEFIVDKDQSFLDALSTMISQKMVDGDKVAKLVIPLLLYRDQSGERVENYLKNVVRKETFSVNQGSKHNNIRMLSGYGAHIYSEFTRLTAREFIVNVLNFIIDLYRKGRLGKIEKKSFPIYKSIIDIIIKSLPLLPQSIWRIHNFFSKQIVDIGTPFLLQKFIVRMIEQVELVFPGIFQSAKEQERFFKKTQYLIDFLNSLYGDTIAREEKISQDIINFIKSTEEELSKSMEVWTQNSANSDIQVNPKLTWQDVRIGLVTLLELANKEFESFEVVLSKQLHKDIIFDLSSLFWSLGQKPGPRMSDLELRIQQKKLEKK